MVGTKLQLSSRANKQMNCQANAPKLFVTILAAALSLILSCATSSCFASTNTSSTNNSSFFNKTTAIATIGGAVGLVFIFGIIGNNSSGSSSTPVDPATPDPDPASSTKAITAYSFTNPNAVAAINKATKTITITVPYNTSVSDLTATFTTTGASVTVGKKAQISGATTNDFTTPVKYIVTAADGSTVKYTVTVTVAPSSAKAITSYSLAGATGTIDKHKRTISVVVPCDTNLTNLVATFTAIGDSITVDDKDQVSGTTANDFNDPIKYIVTAADSSTVKYTVTVTVAPSSAKAITAYSLVGVSAIISGSSITVTVPYGTDVASQAATFTTTGTSVAVGSTAQTSGTTLNDFTNPVIYTVTAANGSTVTYTVTVAKLVPAAPTISSITPSTGPSTGSIIVTINGTGFNNASAVMFGATAATSFTVNSDIQITATSPAGTAGEVDITVTTLYGTSTTLAADKFTYQGVPTITLVFPNTGAPTGGDTIVITGTGFIDVTAVKFGTISATSFTVDSSTQITATSPSGPDNSMIDIIVETTGGTSATSSVDEFTYQGPI